jgi:hypothetical protein
MKLASYIAEYVVFWFNGFYADKIQINRARASLFVFSLMN